MNDVIMTVSEVKKDPKYNVTFGKYLDINPDLYMDVTLSKEIIPARIVTALDREHCDTLYSLLNYKLNEFINITNMGLVALNEVITAIQAYCSKHKGISYSENPLFPKIYDILSEEYSDFIAYCKYLGKTSPYNLLTYDYEVFREKNQLSHRYISTLRKTVAEFCILNTHECNHICSASSLIHLYRYTGYSLFQIFGVFPEMYNSINVDNVGYSSRCFRSLTSNCWPVGRCKTLANVLYCTIDDLYMLPAVGDLSVYDIVKRTRTYVSKHTGTLLNRRHKGVMLVHENQRKLCRMIVDTIRRKDVDKMYLTDNDKHYIDKHMRAALLLDDNMYAAALEHAPAVYDILTALNDFSDLIT